MKKILATTKGEGIFSGESHLLTCNVCGENDRNKLVVEDIMLGAGMTGYDYSFCKKCWDSKKLGYYILDLLNNGQAIKYKEECLDLKEVD